MAIDVCSTNAYMVGTKRPGIGERIEMKTIDVIKTIEWLDKLIGPSVKEALFSGRLMSGGQGGGIT